ncbi:MAG: hypothetical protein B6U73_03345 [Desulfurococcales archaeon ex4484_204]|nr:MAG: hypothetical protein B6U73_03345 [Desulfurococcales archaeon ex4484_204]
MTYKYELLCFNEVPLDINGLRIYVLKPILRKVVELKSKIGMNSEADTVYSKIKHYIYGKECPYVLLRYERKGVEEEVGLRFVGSYREFLLSLSFSKLLGVEVLKESMVPDENVILANSLSPVIKHYMNDDTYVLDTRVELSEVLKEAVALRVITEREDRIVFLKERAKKVQQPLRKGPRGRARRVKRR